MKTWESIHFFKSSAFLGFFFVMLLTTLGIGGATTPVPIVQVKMDYEAPYYRPARAIVSDGVAIQILNPTSSPHTLTHDGCRNSGLCLFDTGAVQPGEDFTITSLSPGKYSYYCELHPIMQGEIVVISQKPLPQPTANKNP